MPNPDEPAEPTEPTGTPKPRSRLRLIIIAVAVVVVLAVGGPFLYLHFIEGSAPPKLSLSASTSTEATGGATVPLDGTWSVASGSQAGYRVSEVLFGQKNTAVGRTSDLTGDIVIKGTTVESGSFSVNMTTVHSDQSQRDGQFRGRVMDTSKYPTATFSLTKPISIGTPPASGVTESVTAVGNLTLRGTTRLVTIPLTVEHVGTTLNVLGDLNLVFADWKIPNPSFVGTVTTDDHGTLEFLLHLSHGTAPQVAAPGPTTTTGGTGLGGANQAFQACLAARGVTLPSNGPGNPGQSNPQDQAAFQACSSLLPARGAPPQVTVSPTTVPSLQLGGQ